MKLLMNSVTPRALSAQRAVVVFNLTKANVRFLKRLTTIRMPLRSLNGLSRSANIKWVTFVLRKASLFAEVMERQASTVGHSWEDGLSHQGYALCDELPGALKPFEIGEALAEDMHYLSLSVDGMVYWHDEYEDEEIESCALSLREILKQIERKERQESNNRRAIQGGRRSAKNHDGRYSQPLNPS